MLQRMREVFGSEDVMDLPNLKAQDRRKVMAEVKMVDVLLHNLVMEAMNVTEVNRLGQGEEEEGERKTMVAMEIREEYWRVEKGFEQSRGDQEMDGSWAESA